MPEQPQLSWADRITASKKSDFKPLDFNTRYNFKVTEATVKEHQNGDFIILKLQVLDGDRQNFKTSMTTFPNGDNPWSFLQIFEAAGFNQEWLVNSNPSTAEIASAFLERPFSADVVAGKKLREDGTPWPDFRNFSPVQVNTSAPQAQPQAATNFGSTPVQAPSQPQAQPQAQTPTAGGSPWNTPESTPASGNGKPMVNPF